MISVLVWVYGSYELNFECPFVVIQVSSCALFVVGMVITTADTSLKLNVKVEDPTFQKQFHKLVFEALDSYI